MLMLLSLTANTTPNFILIGAGLVWQTLPAGWVYFESHYGASLKMSHSPCSQWFSHATISFRSLVVLLHLGM